MSKIGFVGFGEVNTPVDVIVRKCRAAEEALRGEGLELVSVYPVADDSEEVQVRGAVAALAKEPFDALVVCRLDPDPCGGEGYGALPPSADGSVGALRLV